MDAQSGTYRQRGRVRTLGQRADCMAISFEPGKLEGLQINFVQGIVHGEVGLVPVPVHADALDYPVGCQIHLGHCSLPGSHSPLRCRSYEKARLAASQDSPTPGASHQLVAPTNVPKAHAAIVKRRHHYLFIPITLQAQPPDLVLDFLRPL